MYAYNVNVALGNVLRKYREGRGFTQDEFAAYCGLSRAYYGRVERGEHSLTIEKCQKIATTLNVRLTGSIWGTAGVMKSLSVHSLFIAAQDLNCAWGRNHLHNRLLRVTIQPNQNMKRFLPGGCDECRPWIGSVFDHIDYHRRVRSTRKQWF